MRSFSSIDVVRILRREAELLVTQQNTVVSGLATDAGTSDAKIRVAAGRSEGVDLFLGRLIQVFREEDDA